MRIRFTHGPALVDAVPPLLCAITIAASLALPEVFFLSPSVPVVERAVRHPGAHVVSAF
ncbi:hypothetical protein ACQY0O_007455 [Thecaphora frezii]